MATDSRTEIDRREQLLDDYEKGLGLPARGTVSLSTELQEILSMTRSQVENLSGEECRGIAYMLNNHALNIQRAINREQAVLRWAETELDKMVAKTYSSYDKYMKHEIRVASIVNEDGGARQLHQIVVWSKQRCDRLSFLSNQLNTMANSITYNKRARNV